MATAWLLCTMDGGILSGHHSKAAAKAAIPMWWDCTARRLRAGEYEYTTRGDGRGITETYYVMTQERAARNGWEV